MKRFLKSLNVFKILSVTGARQDEQELRAADRLAEDRTNACAELRARMRKNQVYCRQTLADAERTAKTLHDTESNCITSVGLQVLMISLLFRKRMLDRARNDIHMVPCDAETFSASTTQLAGYRGDAEVLVFIRAREAADDEGGR